MVLDVLLVLQDLFELFVDDGHPHWEDVCVLAEVLVPLVALVLVEFFGDGVVVFRVEAESLDASQSFVVRTHIVVRKAFVE